MLQHRWRLATVPLAVYVQSDSSASTHAFHTYRINLSPFTKDFRVWGALNENHPVSLQTAFGRFLLQSFMGPNPHRMMEFQTLDLCTLSKHPCFSVCTCTVSPIQVLTKNSDLFFLFHCFLALLHFFTWAHNQQCSFYCGLCKAVTDSQIRHFCMCLSVHLHCVGIAHPSTNK
jgi:hypothetical protein